MDAAHTLLIPRLSEKTYGLHLQNTYTFNVPKVVNKNQIADAVVAQYGVTVVKVNVIIAKGKAVSSVRKNRRAMPGRRSDVKKAYVTLAAGDSIKVFDTQESK
ncbi:MAG TPA: 50S ribosomal protein L23 [Patescibacteria group bacterium]|jgi:large subunit ribosomal protein L23|nr:50S ribosomal protein L23 [Patescibacteria group bacterium]